MGDIDNKLIQLVKQHPHLYDFDHCKFRDADLKQETWQTVAETLKLPIEAVHRRWKNLRDRFTRERRLTQRASNGAAGAYISRWDHYDAMSFFSPYLKGRRRYPRCQDMKFFATFQENKRALRNILSSENGSAASRPTIIPITTDIVDIVPDILVPKLEMSSPSSVEVEDESSRSDNSFSSTSNKHGQKRPLDEPDIPEPTDHMEYPYPSFVGDDSYYFGMYVSAMLRRLSPKDSSLAKMQILEVLHRVEFDSAS